MWIMTEAIQEKQEHHNHKRASQWTYLESWQFSMNRIKPIHDVTNRNKVNVVDWCYNKTYKPEYTYNDYNLDFMVWLLNHSTSRTDYKKNGIEKENNASLDIRRINRMVFEAMKYKYIYKYSSDGNKTYASVYGNICFKGMICNTFSFSSTVWLQSMVVFGLIVTECWCIYIYLYYIQLWPNPQDPCMACKTNASKNISSPFSPSTFSMLNTTTTLKQSTVVDKTRENHVEINNFTLEIKIHIWIPSRLMKYEKSGWQTWITTGWIQKLI